MITTLILKGFEVALAASWLCPSLTMAARGGPNNDFIVNDSPNDGISCLKFSPVGK
jgi:hypothetical protein